ncbi:MAG: tetratricopeptide repeat protein [Syntrophaceae bacterium]|nr:tetratricopeptide repeat protein [Syntrophaceae bacterium]
MSYINEALRKAQEDKKSPYAAYETILSVSGKKNIKPRKWLRILGILTFLLCVTGITARLYQPEEKKIPVKENLTTANAQIVAHLEQPVVKETTVENKNETVLKTKTISNLQTVAPIALPDVEKITTENKNETALKKKKIEEKIEAKPKTAEAKKLYAQAIQKHQEGKLKEAKRLYKKVVKIDPQNVEALNNLGVIYMNKKVYKWAIIRLNDALKVKYDYPEAHYNLACIYAQNNDLSRSISYLKNAVGFNPQAREWAKKDEDLKVLADLQEFKQLLGKK